ncbi:hypothetical protein DP939_32075 [Spongiactinospora rosea]|uniref:DUF1990 domain-containing protein n=1 Tax=Spongiactinospora rosea TaxID=2248750 RepID=A0A366LQQ4_9ACTN|nr:hypothetical protein [Spongiactinospora rosea]RBQ15960.1 hypothetical protein DP939_32075 [Spongiactinospora rosea]
MPKVLESFIPRPLAGECHELHIRQRPEAVWQALNALSPADLPLVGVLMGIRSLPAKGGAAFTNRSPSMINTMIRRGWFQLADEPQRYVVLGSISQFWRLRSEDHRRSCPPERFRDYAVPGFAKSASVFEVIPAGEGTLLRTETWVSADDADARRKMLAYWRLIRPFSGAIRRLMLHAIAKKAATS